MEDVMNNYDLRKIIWSYLRKNPYKTCNICNCVCMWDKNKVIHEYIVLSENEIYCLSCFFQSFFISHPFM